MVKIIKLCFKDCPDPWANDLTTGKVYTGRVTRSEVIHLIDDIGDLVSLDDDRIIYFEEEI